MSDPFVGEIRMFAGNFAPRSWAFCDGQLLAVGSNDALFSLLGTMYGGDGRTTFGLPDLRGRVPLHAGSGPGLTPRTQGAKSGAEKITLTTNQLASHQHTLRGSDAAATSTNPGGNYLARPDKSMYRMTGTPGPELDPSTIGATGGSASHANIQPFLCVHFIIALVGIFPSRN